MESSSEIRERLERSLAERPLSRAERQALTADFASLERDELRGEARHLAFELVKQRLGKIPPEELLDWLEEVVKSTIRPSAPVAHADASESWFSPDQDCASRIVRLLDSATKSVDICVFTITDDRITRAVLGAHQRRVAVRILTDDDKAHDLGSDIDRLREAGITARVDRSSFHMHHKFALFDGARLLTGSYNWTRGASQDNQENFIVTSDAKLVSAFNKTFAGLWERFA